MVSTQKENFLFIKLVVSLNKAFGQIPISDTDAKIEVLDACYNGIVDVSGMCKIIRDASSYR